MATQALFSAPLQDESSTRIEEALIRAARALTVHLDIEGVCEAVLDAVEYVFGARSSWILLHHPRTRRLRTACSRGEGSEAFEDLEISPDIGILGLAFKTRTVVFVPNVKDDD